MGTRNVASWVAGLRWEDLPAEVRDRARLTFANDLGALLGGLPTPASRIAAAYADSEGTGAGLLVGRGRRAPFAAAAFANGVAGSTLDFEGGHYLGGGIHPGPAVLGSTVTVLDGLAIHGRRLLTALVAGYEVALRLGFLLWPEDRSGQAHTSGTATAVGAAAATASVLGLSAEQAGRALEIAWAHAPVAALQFPMVKESLGWGTATGLSATRLAAAGFKHQPPGAPVLGADVHPPTPFDKAGPADPFVEGLGHTWHLLDVYFKPYAACRYTHAAVDAALALRARHGLGADDVERVVVLTHANAMFLDERAPATDDAAQYSFAWVVAAALRNGRVGAGEIATTFLADPDQMALAAKVELRLDPTLDRHFPLSYPARVEVTTRGGDVHVEQRLGAHGDPGDPMSEAELEAKFRELALRVFDEERFDDLRRLLDAFDDQPVRRLAELLGAARAPDV